MKTKVLKKINLISDQLEIKISNNKDISLINGIGALPIFFYLKFKLTGDRENILKLNYFLEKIIGIINEDDIQLSYCNGLVGVAQMFEYIRSKEVLEGQSLLDIEDALITIDEMIVDYAISKSITIEDVDFLHGSFGAAFYLVSRFSKNADTLFKKKVIQLFELLANIVLVDIEKSNLVKDNTDINNYTHEINCGLAHGLISYIIIFSRFLETVGENEIITKVLKKCLETLLEFESINETSLARFPSIAVNKMTANYNVPLGWCYGDQTISIGLHKASNVLKNEELKKKALNLAYRNLERNKVELIFTSSKYDAGFCHGLSSVAYINKKWYQISKDKKFYEEYEKQIVKILDIGSNEIGIAGYQKFAGKDGYIDSVGFLDGAIGIAIVLIDYLLMEDCGWDVFFLLSDLED
jgi:lantibiotic biosynthesis protein